MSASDKDDLTAIYCVLPQKIYAPNCYSQQYCVNQAKPLKASHIVSSSSQKQEYFALRKHLF